MVDNPRHANAKVPISGYSASQIQFDGWTWIPDKSFHPINISRTEYRSRFNDSKTFNKTGP